MSEEEAVPENYKKAIDDWPQIHEIPVEELFAEGWKPRVKTQRKGERYITLRHSWKDEEGKWQYAEKGLGSYDPERWEILMHLYPRDDIFPTKKSQKKRKEGILASKVAKPKPISSSIHISLETLQWYTWLTHNTGYSGSLEDFINESVDGYFREYHGLELAVIMPKV